jgi:hypothetical protein
MVTDSILISIELDINFTIRMEDHMLMDNRLIAELDIVNTK